MIREIFLITGSLLVFLGWKIRSQKNGFNQSRIQYLRTAEACRRMLAQGSLESRAKANARLRQIFDIENAFTTTDLTYKQQFVNKVKHLLRTDNDGWQYVADTAQAAFDATLTSFPNIVVYKCEIRLVHLVRSVVFTVAVKKFFPSNSDLSLDVGSVWWVTLLINDLWIQSKSQKIAPDDSSRKRKLNTELRHVILDMDTMTDHSPKNNPLNLILPSYEALWGIVFLLTIEVLYRDHPQSAFWQETLVAFVQAPTPANFKSPLIADGGMTVKAIVNEGLRLYPPTRRIYRQHPDRDDWKVAADVEYLHRDPEVWGKDAALFRPSRWLGTDGWEANREKLVDVFMPFGYGPLACPARHESAPLMIGILVGVLVKNLREKRIDIKAVDMQSQISGMEPLKSGRESYGGLVLE